jgi:hypothetical protein
MQQQQQAEQSMQLLTHKEHLAAHSSTSSNTSSNTSSSRQRSLLPALLLLPVP